MSDFLLDPDTGDLVFENGDFVRVTGLAEMRQRVEQKLKLVQGSWFFDRTAGVPYYTKVFGKNKADSVSMNSVFAQAILTIDGVLKLNKPIDYILNKLNRIIALSVDIKTQSGNLVETFEVPI
jgi:hypothetical protein